MIPAPRTSKRLSLPALGLILATVILALVLGAVTWRNLDREQRLMETSLRAEGVTLIRAFGAGSRTVMMMNWAGNPLNTLVRETAKSKSVAYVVIVDSSGHLVTAAGKVGQAVTFPVGRVLAQGRPLTRWTQDPKGRAVFEVASEFKQTPAAGAGGRGRGGKQQSTCVTDCAPGGGSFGPRAVFVGLYAGPFEVARQEDIRHSLLMGGILLLLGSTGFYFLFLSQQNRVAKATLANMELYTRNVIESMPAGLITVDEKGRIASLNDKAAAIFGLPGENVEGKPLDVLPGARGCEVAEIIHEGGEFVERPLECRGANGENIPLKVSASRLRDRAGDPLGTVLIVRDMREIRAMEEALERSRRHAALGRMAAGIAHEIRNPLGTLRGFAQYFSRLSEKDPHAEEYADLMVGEVDRLNRTVSALLQFSRPRDPEFQQVDLAPLLTKTLRLLRDDLSAHNLTGELELAEESMTARADPDLLTQVVINLLQNAVAATGPGGKIVLGAKRENGEIRLWVKDTGKGMEREEMTRMFDPFFTTRKTGTGLGLAVVHQIVDQHGGRIEVSSTPGVGTRVEVILPQEEIDGTI
jgi:two-component system sensor histidine kinase HydH